jgi:hypothetical protein
VTFVLSEVRRGQTVETQVVPPALRPLSARRALPHGCSMSQLARRLDVTVNALFLLAGCTYAFADAILYRLALVAILFMLRLIWAWALVKRAAKREKQQTLTNLADAIVPPLARQDTLQYELSERDRQTIQRSV